MPAAIETPDVEGERNVRLRVLQSFRFGRSTTNPYLLKLVESLPPEIESIGFSWSRAITGRYDVLHVHWPEVLLRGTSRLKTAARQALFLLLIVRITVTRRALVRTLHNENAHEEGSLLERWLLSMLVRRTSMWIRLNPSTVPPTDHPVRTIPHGDYREWFEGFRIPPVVPGRVLYIGLIRAYKGVEELIDAFAGRDDAAATLRIVGKPQSDSLKASIADRIRPHENMSGLFEYVDDTTLAAEVGQAELVVLPYRHMHNSGALILALSLERPVLVPANEVTRALATEIGSWWIQLFEGDLSSAALSSALERIRASAPVGPPDFSARTWSSIGEAHAATYRASRRAACHAPSTAHDRPEERAHA